MLETQLEFSIRPYDVDVAGIVSNIVYVRWLEDLRMELIRRHLPERGLMEQGLMPVLVRTEVDYRSSLRFHDRCTGVMRLEELGRTSTILRAVFRNQKDEVAAEARQVSVFIDMRTGRPVPLPEEVRAVFESARR